MCRYSAMMAADFRTTSSSLKAGLGGAEGFVLLYFAVAKRGEVRPDESDLFCRELKDLSSLEVQIPHLLDL